MLRSDGDAASLSPQPGLHELDRIVQEALTNALRHSRADRARVVPDYAPGRPGIAVEDDGAGLAAVPTGGHGLVGVRERVALHDGSVDIGPGTGGGVRLCATLPVREVT